MADRWWALWAEVVVLAAAADRCEIPQAAGVIPKHPQALGLQVYFWELRRAGMPAGAVALSTGVAVALSTATVASAATSVPSRLGCSGVGPRWIPQWIPPHRTLAHQEE